MKTISKFAASAMALLLLGAGDAATRPAVEALNLDEVAAAVAGLPNGKRAVYVPSFKGGAAVAVKGYIIKLTPRAGGSQATMIFKWANPGEGNKTGKLVGCEFLIDVNDADAERISRSMTTDKRGSTVADLSGRVESCEASIASDRIEFSITLKDGALR